VSVNTTVLYDYRIGDVYCECKYHCVERCRFRTSFLNMNNHSIKQIKGITIQLRVVC